MTEERIDAIRRRQGASTIGAFLVEDEEAGGRFVIVPAEDEDAESLTGADLDMLGSASADIAFLLGELDAIEEAVASDRTELRPEAKDMPLPDLVRAALERREAEIGVAWGVASVEEREAERERCEASALIERLREQVRRIGGGASAEEGSR